MDMKYVKKDDRISSSDSQFGSKSVIIPHESKSSSLERLKDSQKIIVNKSKVQLKNEKLLPLPHYQEGSSNVLKRQQTEDLEIVELSSTDDRKEQLEEKSNSNCCLANIDHVEKAISLAQEVQAKNDELVDLRKEINNFRMALLRGINVTEFEDSDRFHHIPLQDLLRLRLQEEAYALGRTGAYDSMTNIGETGLSNGSSPGKTLLLKEELDEAHRKLKKVSSKNSELQSNFEEVKNATDELEKMKKKVVRMVERSRYEREKLSKTEHRVRVAHKKVDALSEHIEKLMVYLKHEAMSKARLIKHHRRSRKEVDMLTKKNNLLTRKSQWKDKLIIQLRDGGKILEDQLRLMDEKYMELRLKLDWSRTQTDKIIKGREDEIRSLRDQVTLLKDSSPSIRLSKSGPMPMLSDYNFGRENNIRRSMTTGVRRRKRRPWTRARKSSFTSEKESDENRDTVNDIKLQKNTITVGETRRGSSNT